MPLGAAAFVGEDRANASQDREGGQEQALEQQEPLAFSAVARRLRQGVPSRRATRRVASTRTVDAGGWPRSRERPPSQHSIAVAISPRILLSTSPSAPKQHRWEDGQQTAGTGFLNSR